MPIDGVQGDATREQHRKWMDIETIHWNVSRNMNTSAGSAANREPSQPTVSEVILTKLFQEACSGRTGKRAAVHMGTTGNPGNTDIKLTLTNPLIAGYSIDSNGVHPIETVKLNFTKIKMKYTPYDENQSPMIASYNLPTTKAA